MSGGRCPLNWIPARLRDALQRHLFGLTADEIRYTFEDVRQELRAMHAELRDDIAAIRRDVDRLSGKTVPLPDPLPAARGEGDETRGVPR